MSEIVLVGGQHDGAEGPFRAAGIAAAWVSEDPGTGIWGLRISLVPKPGTVKYTLSGRRRDGAFVYLFHADEPAVMA